MSIRSLVVLGGVVIAVSTSAAPAVAADELALSRDGEHWFSTIDAPLLAGPTRWVPGDSSTARFYVRNQAGDVGDLTVDVIGTRVLLGTGDLEVAARGGGGEWTTVYQGGTHRLVTSPRIPPGEARAVDVRVSFDPAATNSSQLLSGNLHFRVTLTDTSIVDGPAPVVDGPTPEPVVGGPTVVEEPAPVVDGPNPVVDGPNPMVDGPAPGLDEGSTPVGDELTAGGGLLPGTGSPELRWFAGISSVLVGIGLALVKRRRQAEEEAHV